MGPELLEPELFGFKDSRPTKQSDSYALGMVILEVLSGQTPFPLCKEFTVMRKVIGGERPGRPQEAEGIWFTDGLWGTLEQCWSPQPKDRPTIEAVLEHLEQVSVVWQPLPPSEDDGAETDTDEESSSTGSDPGMFPQSITSPRVTLKDKVPGTWVPPHLSLPTGSLTQGPPDGVAIENAKTSEGAVQELSETSTSTDVLLGYH